MKKFEYNFPECTQYKGTLNQILKIVEEANEVLDAFVNGGCVFSKTMDVIQACETLLRAHPQAFMQAVYESAVEKNRECEYN